MKKFSLLAGASALVLAQGAQAETFTSPMADAGWAYSAGTATATGVTSMHMLMQSSTAIKKFHWYRIAGTVSGYSCVSGTACALRPFVGYSMPSAPTGSWVTLASTSDIADNFTTSLGLTTSGASTKTIGGPGDSSEVGGAYRFQCTHAKFGLEDPVVYPAIASGHIHKFVGNTAVDRNTTTTTIRTTGMSTCGDSNDPLHPVNRSSYWSPAVINTHKGVLVKINGSQIYYKQPSSPTLNYTGSLPGSENAALYCAEVSPTTQCVQIPRGLKYIAGYKKSTGTCGPGDTGSCAAEGTGFTFSCHTSPGTGGTQLPNGVTVYTSMEAARASGNCVLGGQLKIGLTGASCWDGVNIDSPDHRSHISFDALPTAHFGNVGCGAAHPVNIPTFSEQDWYTIDQDFLDGYWKLTSDEMVNGAVAGSTSHLDYFWGWSPTAAATWHVRCIENHNSCSVGELGDGTRLKMGGGMNDDGSEMSCNGCSLTRHDRLAPTRFYGMGPNIKANGAFSVVIRAADDGVWGLMGLDGLNATVTGVTVTAVNPNG